VSAFANCGRAVAHVRGSYVPQPDSCTAANGLNKLPAAILSNTFDALTKVSTKFETRYGAVRADA
jgi:hypothetical protein